MVSSAQRKKELNGLKKSLALLGCADDTQGKQANQMVSQIITLLPKLEQNKNFDEAGRKEYLTMIAQQAAACNRLDLLKEVLDSAGRLSIDFQSMYQGQEHEHPLLYAATNSSDQVFEFLTQQTPLRKKIDVELIHSYTNSLVSISDDPWKSPEKTQKLIMDRLSRHTGSIKTQFDKEYFFDLGVCFSATKDLEGELKLISQWIDYLSNFSSNVKNFQLCVGTLWRGFAIENSNNIRQSVVQNHLKRLGKWIDPVSTAKKVREGFDDIFEGSDRLEISKPELMIFDLLMELSNQDQRNKIGQLYQKFSGIDKSSFYCAWRDQKAISKVLGKIETGMKKRSSKL